MKRLVPVLIASALLVAASATPSEAFIHHHHHHVTRSRPCTGSSGWWLEVGRMMMMDDIWVRFEVNTDRPGQDWKIKLTDDRTAFWSGTRTTRPDGDFAVHTYSDDRSGSDTIVGRAVNQQTGEVCEGSATLSS